MAEAVILSLIQMLEKYCVEEPELVEWATKDMREILDIMKDTKFVEGRRLSFLVSDLVHMAHKALDVVLDIENTYFWMNYIESWIGEIKMRMLKLGVDGPEIEPNSESVDEDHVVVGLDKDIEMVIRTMIFYSDEQPSVVVIKGMSGIGKTTLAREIYNHAVVIKRFQYRAWVCVSNVLTIKEIVIKLLLHVVVDGENLHTLEEMDNQSLLDMLRQRLQGLPYLIVLDDLPKEIYLESLLSAIESQGCGESKLVFTSHMTHDSVKINCIVHKMEPLDFNMSWQLFYETINGGNKLRSEQKFPKELEYQGKQMLRKCGGLPLAIKEVANQLAQKKASIGSEWEQLLASVDLGSTLELLEPYYQKLDPELLPCFMYMALFKENTTLRANKLSQIWKVEGRGIYDSDSYLYGLVDESVIDEVNDKSTRQRREYVLRSLEVLDSAEIHAIV
ncbi:disease resistance protein RPP13-like [Salvia hispanica]|uniref:disease resistance protein RPP13-like n=1 Tax=Salvia hispanica TaxID=49212 RepID=UPI002008FCDE|nr:disease resistance protein RPP13-like [Salvia hispanica]